MRSHGSRTRPKRCVPVCANSVDSRSRCPARRKDRTTAASALPAWHVSTTISATFAGTSCIGYLNELAKTHDRLVIEDLNVSGMLRNHRLAQAIGDAGWAQFARQLCYKTDWRNGELAIADRWYPSSQVCSRCGDRNRRMTLSDRVFICDCGYSDDRDRNAAANLAKWAEQHHLEPRTPKHGGRVTNVRRRDGADRHVTRVGEAISEDAGTDVQATPVA
jgi:putative transposase